MSNPNPDQSNVVWTFDKAVEYTTGLLDQTMKNADIPAWARAKIGITGHIDTGIKIHSEWEDGDDAGVIKEVASALAGVAFGAAILTVSSSAIAIGFSVGLGGLISWGLGELYDKQIDGSLGAEASAFLIIRVRV